MTSALPDAMTERKEHRYNQQLLCNKAKPLPQPTTQATVTEKSMAEAPEYRGCELGRDLLRLVADVEFRDLCALFIIWREHACQHPDEGGLTSAILPQHHQYLAVCKGPFLYIQPEAAL